MANFNVTLFGPEVKKVLKVTKVRKQNQVKQTYTNEINKMVKNKTLSAWCM